MPFKIIRNDITKMQVDAIVNTANVVPAYGEGVDTAVYEAAGVEALLAERQKIGFLDPGEVAITPGFALPAKYIIHAVSPYYEDGESGEEALLRSCYQKSLALAHEYHCKSIAFPLISTGSFGYPKEDGMRIAVDEINSFLLKNPMLVYLVVFDEESTTLGRRLAPELEAYIDEHYVEKKQRAEYLWGYREYSRREQVSSRGVYASVSAPASVVSDADYSSFLEDNQSALIERIKHRQDTFQEYLFYLIETKGLTNAEVYKRALITKQLFSKIKLKRDYHPDKATAMRLCVGAKLNPDETKDLLARAGYALSPCDKRDIIFSFFIEHDVYDMIEIDIALEEHGLPCFIE